MKLLFAHDHIFRVDNHGTVFSPGKLPYKIFQRYLRYFDEMIVVARSKTVGTDSDNLNVSSGPNISFFFLPNLATPRALLFERNKIQHVLTDLISSVDAVVVRLPSENGSLVAKIAHKLNKPWAVEVVACAWDGLWNYGSISGKVYAPLMYMRTRNIISKSPFAVYVTSKFLQKRYPSHGYFCGVSDVEIDQPDEIVLQNRLINIKNSKNQDITFGLIGSLTSKYKGVQTALAALSKIRNDIPSFRFKILGDGSNQYYRQLVAKLNLNDNVIFCGTLPSGPAVYGWLDNIDIYLQPSFTEGLPRTVVEALSRACPAIGSTAGGIPELIDVKFLHTPGNDAHLSDLIKILSLNKELRASQAIQNFNTAKDYSSCLLNQRRDAFWKAFSGSIHSSGKYNVFS